MSERDDTAKAFHNIYLVTAKVFKWPIRPEVDVEFERLSKDAQELDYALADFHLAEIARLRAQLAQIEMTCEAHPWLFWPHNDCHGPGMPTQNSLDRLQQAEAVVRAAEPALKELRVAQAWVVNKSHKDQIELWAGVLREIKRLAREV